MSVVFEPLVICKSPTTIKACRQMKLSFRSLSANLLYGLHYNHLSLNE